MCILNFLSSLLPIDEVAVYDENGNFIRYESLEEPEEDEEDDDEEDDEYDYDYDYE